MSLAIVSSIQEVQEANQFQQLTTGRPLQISPATNTSMQKMQSEAYTNLFQTSEPVDGGDILENITNYFARYEVPLGLISKLLALTEYKLNFIIDDSGSMVQGSDVWCSDAMSTQMQEKVKNSYGKLTRWQEVEDRLHILLDILAYIPVDITVTFLNRKDSTFDLNHKGKTPEAFALEAHQEISKVFNRKPVGGTPIFKELTQAFQATRPTMHYLFTDGEPSDVPSVPYDYSHSYDPKKRMQPLNDLVKNRPNPKQNALTFMSCTNDTKEAQWMKELEGAAGVLYVAELDDFNTEAEEVLAKQGPVLPFSKGFWLLCQLVAAINPDDLDALDEDAPLTKKTLSELMGYTLTLEAYSKYFTYHREAKKFQHLLTYFASENLVAKDIVIKQPDGNYIINPNLQQLINQQPSQFTSALYSPQQLTPSAPPMNPHLYPQLPSQLQQPAYNPSYYTNPGITMWQPQNSQQMQNNNNNQQYSQHPGYQPQRRY